MDGSRSSRTDMEPTMSWDTPELCFGSSSLLLRQNPLTHTTSHIQVLLSLSQARPHLASHQHPLGSPPPPRSSRSTKQAATTLHHSMPVSGNHFPPQKRVIALTNNNLFAGFYVVTPHKRIRPIFQPQRCTLTDLDTGIEQEFLVGHGSNDPRFLRAEYVPVNLAGTSVCLADLSSVEVPPCYHSGPAFKAANITGTHTLTLQEDTTYKVVHLPLALPIPFGVDDTTNGTITEATQDILDTTSIVHPRL